MEYDARGRLRDYAITGSQWGAFLGAVFEEWYRHDMGAVSIRLFESVLARLVHHVATDCTNSAACNRYLVVEHNGDVFPCDFFVRPEYKLGNVLEHSFEEIRASEAYRNFSAGKQRWGEACAACEFLYLCMGDCPKYRTPPENKARRPSAPPMLRVEGLLQANPRPLPAPGRWFGAWCPDRPLIVAPSVKPCQSSGDS